MSSKRSFQQREEEPWLRYPESFSSKDHSRSSYSSSVPYKNLSSLSLDNTRHDFLDLSQQQLHNKTDMAAPITNHRHTIYGMNSVSSTLSPSYQHRHQHHHLPGGVDKTLVSSHNSYRSPYSRRGPAPRTLSEELSTAMYKSPEEDSYPSPLTPSGVLPSPADMSVPSSSSSTLSSGHFPLFKPSLTSQQNSHGTGGQKPRPSPLSLPNSFRHSNTQEGEDGQGGKNFFSSQPGSPTSAASQDTSTTMDSASVLGESSFRSSNRSSRSTMSSAASTTSSYYSTASSPRSSTAPCSALCHHSKTNYHLHHSSCLHTQRNQNGSSHHHPACQLHSSSQQSDSSSSHHGAKFGRATKGVQRFGVPQFRPEMNDSHPGWNERISTTSTKTTSTSTSRSGGYGIQRGNMDDDDDMDGVESYASEPPKKRRRFTASMLIDAAVETVIFTGAVALTAYQLFTGKGRQGDSHSKRSSFASEDDDSAQDEPSKNQEEDPMEEKLVFDSDTPSTPEPGRRPRPFSSSSLGRSSRGYYKVKTPRPYRSRHSYCAPGNGNSGHSRSTSAPVRPNTGTEDSDEAFLRMEAQLNSLIAEGKRALNSRIEVWDEE
ncbi:hypothetical protein BGZ46_002511 [Entomortierella lignicola]|nr:hypothetical protein BGZ46_002511 [Entomortierella lignicola]